MTRPSLLMMLLVLVASGSLNASEPAPVEYKAAQIVLLQPDWLLGKRVEAESLAQTLNAVQLAASHYRAPGKSADWVKSCSIFVVMRHPQLLRTWSVCDGADEPALDEVITKKMTVTSIARINEGNVIVQLVAPDSSTKTGIDRIVFPATWHQVAEAQNSPLEVEQLVTLIWPM